LVVSAPVSLWRCGRAARVWQRARCPGPARVPFAMMAPWLVPWGPLVRGMEVLPSCSGGPDGAARASASRWGSRSRPGCPPRPIPAAGLAVGPGPLRWPVGPGDESRARRASPGTAGPVLSRALARRQGSPVHLVLAAPQVVLAAAPAGPGRRRGPYGRRGRRGLQVCPATAGDALLRWLLRPMPSAGLADRLHTGVAARAVVLASGAAGRSDGVPGRPAGGAGAGRFVPVRDHARPPLVVPARRVQRLLHACDRGRPGVASTSLPAAGVRTSSVGAPPVGLSAPRPRRDPEAPVISSNARGHRRTAPGSLTAPASPAVSSPAQIARAPGALIPAAVQSRGPPRSVARRRAR